MLAQFRFMGYLLAEIHLTVVGNRLFKSPVVRMAEAPICFGIPQFIEKTMSRHVAPFLPSPALVQYPRTTILFVQCPLLSLSSSCFFCNEYCINFCSSVKCFYSCQFQCCAILGYLFLYKCVYIYILYIRHFRMCRVSLIWVFGSVT